MEKRTEKEYAWRQKMIDAIEGRVAIWDAVWNEWPTKQIEILYYNLLNRG